MKNNVGVCQGPRCCDYGGKSLLDNLRQNGIDAEVLGCQSLCAYSPVVKFNGQAILNASLEEVLLEHKNAA